MVKTGIKAWCGACMSNFIAPVSKEGKFTTCPWCKSRRAWVPKRPPNMLPRHEQELLWTPARVTKPLINRKCAVQVRIPNAKAWEWETHIAWYGSDYNWHTKVGSIDTVIYGVEAFIQLPG